MKKVLPILQGFAIGIGKIIPGVSGTMIAIKLNIYEKMIKIISNFKQIKKENLSFIVKISLGILLAITVFSNLIYNIIKINYSLILLFFISIIFSTIPRFVKEKKVNIKYSGVLIIICLIIIILLQNSNLMYVKIFLNKEISYFLLGIIEGLTMIIPGISGTAIQISINMYETVLEIYSNLLNITYLISNAKKILFFSLGIFATFFLMSKVINYFLQKHKILTNSSILSLIVISLISMINQFLASKPSKIEVILVIITCSISCIVSLKIVKQQR